MFVHMDFSYSTYRRKQAQISETTVVKRGKF